MPSGEKKSSADVVPDVQLTQVVEDGGPDGTSIVDEVPDGGIQARLVLFGTCVAFLSTFGIVNSFGIFQDYYASDLLPNSSSSTISIIGAFQLFLVYSCGAIVGRIFDAFGATVLFWSGTVILVLSMMLVSVCKQLYQFFLVQGLLFGIGNALIFTPCLAVVGQWYKRRRGLAMGILAASSSLGGVIYPIMIQQLIPRVGFPWAVRLVGFVLLACLCISCLTVRARLPLKKKVTLSGIVDFNGFRDVQYTLAAIGSFLYFYTYFVPLFYIQVYGTRHGIDPSISKYLLVIMNALGIVSRSLPGFLADVFGVLEVMIPCMFLSGIFVFALWLPFPSSGPVVAFSALYGLFSGAFLPLLPAYLATRSPVEKLGARMGSLYIFVGISSLVGTPTAGAFLPDFTQKNFDRLIIFTGVLLLAGSSVFSACYALAYRERKSRSRQRETQQSEKQENMRNTDAVGEGCA